MRNSNIAKVQKTLAMFFLYEMLFQAAAHYLRGSQSTSTMAKKSKCFKEEEKKREL